MSFKRKRRRAKRIRHIVFVLIVAAVLVSPIEMKGRVWLTLLILICGAFVFILRRVRRRGVGPAAVGAFYEMLHQDKRRAVEVIVERKAEEQLPEDAEGSE